MFFFLSPHKRQSVMPEKGKDKAQGGQDTREGGSCHEKRAAKKSKTQMGVQQKNLTNLFYRQKTARVNS